MILVDTSVWVEHLRRRDEVLVAFLQEGAVLTHPCVVGELACGSLPHRDDTLELLQALPRARTATDEEALALIRLHRLHGTGIGWVDIHLLAAARLTKVPLWTADETLAAAAGRLEVAFRPTR